VAYVGYTRILNSRHCCSLHTQSNIIIEYDHLCTCLHVFLRDFGVPNIHVNWHKWLALLLHQDRKHSINDFRTAKQTRNIKSTRSIKSTLCDDVYTSALSQTHSENRQKGTLHYSTPQSDCVILLQVHYSTIKRLLEVVPTTLTTFQPTANFRLGVSNSDLFIRHCRSFLQHVLSFFSARDLELWPMPWPSQVRTWPR